MELLKGAGPETFKVWSKQAPEFGHAVNGDWTSLHLDYFKTDKLNKQFHVLIRTSRKVESQKQRQLHSRMSW
jgi:hypothetical protein